MLMYSNLGTLDFYFEGAAESSLPLSLPKSRKIQKKKLDDKKSAKLFADDTSKGFFLNLMSRRAVTVSNRRVWAAASPVPVDFFVW
jgi:hypothetical protein